MSNLHEYIIKSAQSYLTYIEDNNLGTDEIKIAKSALHSKNILDKHSQEIHKKYVLTLSLEQQIIATDYLQLYIDSLMIDLDLIEEKNYNERTRTLDITFDDSTLQGEAKEKIYKLLEDSNANIFNNDITNHLSLFVDLKFLVKNILLFCRQELKLCLPNVKPLELTLKLESYINPEQKNAIKGVFNNSISYIWGISGSGKTQVVLFSCLLNIIVQNKKALVLAPTNTALEQIFTILINKCDTKGIVRTKFLRLGMSSSEFLSHYPEVCIQNYDEDSKKAIRLFNVPNLKDRLAECLVIGLTLDSFVKRYQILSTLDFAHIFLDECAFSPLIKLIAPLQLNAPITLLGDHKQLMPICLMDSDTIKTKSNEICLWSLNALFIESMLNNHDSLHLANNHDDISFNDIANYKLTATHRYGDNLAQILDRYVYHNGLRGFGRETQIYFIDSKAYGQGYSYISSSNNNESLAEANAILSIARNLGEYAVITPFRDQQKLLVRKGIQRSKVFTIHKSQGKEFECIVFSPVKFSKFMTNSMHKSALFSLNVAISRLKQSLIIVCDYDFWIRKQGQLISSLLQVAKPYYDMH